MNILVSSCLLGENCKYSGGNNLNIEVCKLGEKHTLISVCPECLSGMSTPREPSERQGERVVNAKGEDVTNYFIRGAMLALALAEKNDCKWAVLKAKSPSCGCGEIYDGTFKHVIIQGNGITAEALLKNNIFVINENKLDKFKV